MQRPVMDPMFAMDVDTGSAESVGLASPRTRRVRRLVRIVLMRALRALKWCVRWMLYKPLKGSRSKLRVEDGHFLMRWARAIGYRLIFVPLFIALASAAFVFKGTHPLPRATEGDPSAVGLYFDPINFTSKDGTRLGGWVVPVVDAQLVLEKKEKVLRTKQPAIVLVHDFGDSPAQMLPYLKALHEDGFVTLTLGLRGAGTGFRSGQTFGLREAEDVAAAIEQIRRRPFVDSERVAVIGIGTGATAVLRAAVGDSRIKASVLIDPVHDGDATLAAAVGPQRVGLQWMQPVCKWTFELCYRVDAEELDFDFYKKDLEHRSNMVLNRDENFAKARPFLRTALAAPKNQNYGDAVTRVTE